MKDTMGIVYTVENGIDLKDLTQKRSVAAIPFGGRYRVIDFILSNMVNSGIRNVGIITQNNYSSLMDHLGTGREWDLNRKRNGLFILPPYVNDSSPGWYRGSVDALHSIMSYIRKSAQKYVLLTGSHMLCNIDFNKAFEFHMERSADITIIYKEEKFLTSEELRKYTLVRMKNDGRVWDLEVNPRMPKSSNIYTRMCIIEKHLLEYLVEECAARGQSDFIMDILMKKIDSLKIYAYPHNGYLGRIDSIKNYYEHNMELLNPEIRNELFFKPGSIFTKIKDKVPAKYGDTAVVQNCMIADGCLIEGEVYNSILFRGVSVARGAVIKNSIVMQDSVIYENASLENVITDKEVMIGSGRRLIGQENYPVVVGKRAEI
jgi:glucose-1-phosphate adenylyltransferase